MTDQQQTDTYVALTAAKEAKQMLEVELAGTIATKLAEFYKKTGLSCNNVAVVMVDVRTISDKRAKLILDHVRVDVALE